MSGERPGRAAFNSPLETGLRAVSLLVAGYPQRYDIQELVAFDHLVVHTGDVGGPASLHAAVPMRTAELLVRRDLVERGILLMVSKCLIEREVSKNGIYYRAGEFAETFLDSLSSEYMHSLRERAAWTIGEFGNLDESDLRGRINTFFDHWIDQFQVEHRSLAGEQ